MKTLTLLWKLCHINNWNQVTGGAGEFLSVGAEYVDNANINDVIVQAFATDGANLWIYR